MKKLAFLLLNVFFLISFSSVQAQYYTIKQCKNGYCSAIKSNGMSCGNCAGSDGLYCGTHKKKSSTNYTGSWNAPVKQKCAGYTSSGFGCSRNVKSGSYYCSQHTPSNTEQGLAPNATDCVGITSSGKSCRNKAKSGSMYCGKHGG